MLNGKDSVAKCLLFIMPILKASWVICIAYTGPSQNLHTVEVSGSVKAEKKISKEKYSSTIQFGKSNLRPMQCRVGFR